MFQTKTKKENLLHRLKIIKGHLEKVIDMVEHDEYCIDIIHQSQAIQSALRKIDEISLEHHLSHCVVDHMKHGREKQAITEVMKVFEKK